ncbi:MAG: choice-of-anchor D domain-containing protein [bacterium]
MSRFLAYILLTLLFTVQLYSDSFITQTPSPSKFPYIEMPFYVRHDDGTLYTSYSESDFTVEENGVKIIPQLVKLECTETQAPVQVLLVVDISTSMGEIVDGRTKIEWVKKSLIEFIDNIELSPFSTIGISTFCSKADNICDFTYDKAKLLAAVNKISNVASQTDFNVAFLETPWGAAPRLEKQPNFNRTIIFLSDGKHSSGNHSFDQVSVSNQLKNLNIKLYAIIISEEFDQSISYLRYIAEETKGIIYWGRSPNTLPALYRELAQLLTKKYNCILRWLSDLYCDKEPRVTNVKITYRPLNQSARHTYTAPEWSVFNVIQDKPSYIFGNPPPDQPVEMDIKISPKPFDMTIYNIFLTDNNYFNIIDWGDGTGIKPSGDVFLPANKWLTIKVRFTQKIAYLPRKSLLNIIAYPCNAQIPLYGGDIKIILEKPVASDIFTSCDSIDIEWSGTTDAAMKELYYRFDNEPWTLIADSLTGFTYTWTPPHRDGKCQIMVVAYPFFDSEETVSDISEYFPIIKPEITSLYSPMVHDLVLIGSNSNKTFADIITNRKTEPVKIVSWHFIGKAKDEFSVVSIEKVTIAPNDTSDIEIAFAPTLDGQRNASLILVPECGDSLAIDIIGWGTCNTEALDSINFGSKLIDAVRDSTIIQVFHNPMNKTVTITPYLSGLNKNQFEMVGLSGTEKIPIGPFSSFDIEIKFKPTSYGYKTATLNFGVEGCSNKTTALTGFGEYKGISVNTLDFGRKRYKSTFNILNLIISNKDKFFKNINEINIIKNNGEFKILNLNLPLNIDPFEDKPLQVVFDPATIDTFDTEVLVITTDGDTLHSRFQGMNYLPELIMKSACPSTLNVGESGIATIWLYNPSITEKLKIGVCSITNNPDEFDWIGGNPSSLSIPIQDSLLLELDYHPQVGGKHRCIIEILADNYDGTYKQNWFINDLDVICDAMTFDYTQPVFADLLLCDNEQSEFSISNLSYALDLDFYLDEVIITGPDSDAFTLIGTDTLTLAGGETKKLTVRFDAKHDGLHTAHLSIPNSANLPLDIELQAEGKMIVQSATPVDKTFIPSEWYNVIFSIDIPTIKKEYIDSLKMSILWNSDVLHINPVSYNQLVTSDITKPEYLVLDSIFYQDGQVNYWFKSHLLTNKKYDLFSYNFLGLLANYDTTSIIMNIDYLCKNDDKIVSFFKKGDYCFEEGYVVKIMQLANYLNGPYPNPTKGEIRVGFGTEKESSISLAVYSIEGKLVKTLLSKVYKEGNYQETFDLKVLSRGSYILKYTAGNFQSSKRFVLEP